MKLAYVSKDNPLDIMNFSGISYYMAKGLEQQAISLEYIGPLSENHSLTAKIKSQLYRRLFKKNYLPWAEPKTLKGLASQVSEKLSALRPDIIFSLGTMQIAYLESRQPIVYTWDCTFSGLLDAYPCFLDLPKESIEYGIKMEQLALDKCSLAIFPSEWAAQTAHENHHVDPAKIKVVPYGANLVCERTSEDIKEIINRRDSKCCNLLFIGIDWDRKGGEIAYEVAKELNKLGLETTLTIVGCTPNTNKPIPNYVKVLGFINKFTNSGLRQIEHLLATSHFLILPSRAENYGIVFCEASSFATPSLATNIGGIPTAVHDGVNGKLFSIDADSYQYCEYILNLFSEYSVYKELALSSYNEYQKRLNWKVAGSAFKNLLKQI